jgi:cytochrome b involved in lipid metabolism
MLTPLESLFDAIAGLPMHPLVVHFAVVLLPLAALALIVLVAVPKWADTYGWLTLAGLAVGAAASFVAKESGEALAARVGDPGSHASWGDLLPWLAVALLILAGVWFLLHRRARQNASGRSAAATAVGLLAAVMALVVTGVTVVVGHTGAQAAWAGTISDTKQEPAASAPATPGNDGGKRTPSASSSAAASYTLADVARHANASSCWTAIGGNVYDVTKWVGQHPGGQRAILGLCGKDGTSAFTAQHGGQRRPEADLKQFLIGTLS